ncbi:hypothetical protein HJC99_00200 [Candidatus Saccharibacteria bacterium]|nr:hypothetical protein [Candidatus Saccharibacteria bacterium]
MMNLRRLQLARTFSRITKSGVRDGGYILLTVLVAAVILSALGASAAQVLLNNERFTQFNVRQDRALDVAEAGINYYLWHLSHNPSDYTDGHTPTPPTSPYGPYVHSYYDNNNVLQGTYTLYITPPVNGSTVTTVRSVGQVPNLTGGRTILAQLGQPSFSNYIFLSNSELNFSPTATTTGPVFSNIGVQFDGVNNGPVMGAKTSYIAGSTGTSKPDVWGAGGPKSQWQFPVPSIDFTAVTANLASLQTQAQTSSGVYLNNSRGIGFYLNLRSDGTIDVYKVTNQSSSGITKTFIRNQAAPTNGILFSTEEVWLSGTSWPGRITIVAAKLPDSPATRRSINIIGNLTYAAKDGSAAIGLVAQQDVFIPRYVPNVMEVDAGMLAQYGSVGYDTANGGLKSSFTLYGSLGQNANDYGFKVPGCGSFCSGFPTTAYNFDSHLIYAPPPGFPTTGNYSVLTWREQLFSP